MSSCDSGVIRKLDEVVINRIAAGEVIQRPANALKEMIENSIDAKSSSIQVTVKQGGLKLLQIQDNGTGIRKDDMGVVCERFTTSKLNKFEDLHSIQTHGFRGEALASISHVAHVTIVSRTADSKCSYRGMYVDSKLKEACKPCAGNVGTQITVEDLFYNVTTRRKALSNTAEEHSRIVDVVSRYAVHNCGIGFLLKKHGESNCDVRTAASSSTVDNIRAIHGASIAKELLDFECHEGKYAFKAHGYLTNANYSAKKFVFLLFINNRLVESSALKKAIDAVYQSYLPKSTHPFIYLSVDISPENIDVNVHPTKHEVHFLHEDCIVETIQKAVETTLLSANSSRTYFMQTLLPVHKGPLTSDPPNSSKNTDKILPQDLVRTDYREQKLDAFLSKRLPDGDTPAAVESDSPDQQKTSCNQDTPAVSVSDTKLTSVLGLRQCVRDDCHSGLLDLIRGLTFVGCVTSELCLIQHETYMYLVHNTKLTSELFYQIILNEFGRLGYLKLSEPASVYDLVLLALNSDLSGWTESDGPREDLAHYAATFLKTKADMINEYFSVQLDKDANLLAIPMLLDKYIPDLNYLPLYILRLATEVNWESEDECFESIARETARFCSLKKPLTFLSSQPSTAGSMNSDTRWTTEHVIYPALRSTLQPPKSCAEDSSILQIANLRDLYKVFERC